MVDDPFNDGFRVTPGMRRMQNHSPHLLQGAVAHANRHPAAAAVPDR